MEGTRIKSERTVSKMLGLLTGEEELETDEK
jgi:hypothetical protein